MHLIKPYRFGILAEWLVITIYRLKFYKFIAHRIRNYAGEIDIVCRKGNLLVFIEVKARSYKFDQILCNKLQLQRIKRAAQLFIIHNNRYRDFNLRFDLVIVIPFKFPEIIENAW